MLTVLGLGWTRPIYAQVGGKVALVIGNGSYQAAGQLVNPQRDSRTIAGSLARAGFKTITVRSDLSLQQFQLALRDFSKASAGASVAVVYYAGHGIEAGGRNWLLPVDAVLANEQDLSFEAVDLSLVMEAISGASLRIVLLDACRNNPFGRSWRSGSRSVSRGLAATEFDDVLVVYAAAPGQTAADGTGENSPFAASLAKRLVEPGVPVQMLGGLVRDDVLEATEGKQRPFISASITGRPVYLVGPATAMNKPAVVAPPTPAVIISPSAGPPLGGAVPVLQKSAFQIYKAGYDAFHQKRFAEAESMLSDFSTRFPGDANGASAENMAGRAALAINKPATAAKAFFRGYQKFPRNPVTRDSLLGMAEALMVLKKPQDACKVYDEFDTVYLGAAPLAQKELWKQGREKAQCSGATP